MKIVIGGQLGKEEIKDALDAMNRATIETKIMDDMSAAMAVKTGQADCYLGACMTGGGGALAMPIMMLGYNQCLALTKVDEREIRAACQRGVKAFGFTPTMTSKAVPVIVSCLLDE